MRELKGKGKSEREREDLGRERSELELQDETEEASQCLTRECFLFFFCLFSCLFTVGLVICRCRSNSKQCRGQGLIKGSPSLAVASWTAGVKIERDTRYLCIRGFRRQQPQTALSFFLSSSSSSKRFIERAKASPHLKRRISAP